MFPSPGAPAVRRGAPDWAAMVPTMCTLTFRLAEQRRMLHDEQGGEREILVGF